MDMSSWTDVVGCTNKINLVENHKSLVYNGYPQICLCTIRGKAISFFYIGKLKIY